MKPGLRAARTGEGRRFLARLPLLWQWLLVFVLSVVVLRHYRWWQLAASLDDVTVQAEQHKDLPGLAGLRQQWAKVPPDPSSLQRASTTPPRDCPVSVPWDTLPRDPGKTKAAVFTPYNIVFGGGERYLLSVVAVLQDMGYTVDVLVFARNVCQTKEQLLKVAAGLRVALKPELVSLHQVPVNGIHIQAPADGYSVFLSLGNDKLPTFAGLGHVNFYMCQFPFDLERPPRAGTTKALSTYDYVLLNSGFTDGWYARYAGEHLQNSLRVWNAAPAVVVLHPPVEPFPATSQLRKAGAAEGVDSAAQPKREHILVLGRFFKGRQSKGHAAAIDIFERILPQLPASTQLHLVGNLMPGHKDYLAKLREKARDLPVHFHIGVAAHVIEELMHISLVQWHLTGIDLAGQEDPASEEHFGISVAEGMSAGVIPVVLNRGGVTDIVQHEENGFLAPDGEAIAATTVRVFGLDGGTLERLRRAAIFWVERFSQKAFARNFRVLANRGVLTKPFRFLQQQTLDVVLSRSFVLPKASKKAALIIEPRQHYAFEYAVKNTLFHLGPEWGLHVYHGTANEKFVHKALASVQNVNFRPLDAVSVSIPMLNQLLKSSDFWGELEAAGVRHVLFFQTDSLLVHGDIQPFMQYDYAGAPWHRQNERWKHTQGSMPNGVGNGGLSLRSVPAMAALSRAHGNNVSNAAQEDFFYSQLMEQSGGEFQVAPRQRAYSFCVEVPCDDLEAGGARTATGTALQTLPAVPMALHASWYYFWGTSRRFADLLALLEMSVCGPDAYAAQHAASASPKPDQIWEQSNRALRALEARRKELAKRQAASKPA